jgi:hypothetical protein
VIALDTSLSMSAPGQFEKARQLARRAIDQANGGLISVITFADTATVVGQPSGDGALAIAAVDSARPGVRSTSYRSALNAAANTLRGRRGTIVVVTDLQANGWDAGDHVSLPASVSIEIADVGPAPENLAIVSARVVDDRIVASVRNTGVQPRQARVVLNVNAATDTSSTTKAAETTIPISPEKSSDVTFLVPRGRWATVAVDDERGVAADNARYLVLDANARPTILVVTSKGDLSGQGFYVQQALVAASADGRGFEVEGVGGADLQQWDRARFDAHSAVIVLSTRGLDHHGRSLIAEYARKGGGVLIVAGAEVEGEVVQEALGDVKISIVPPSPDLSSTTVRTLAPADVRHPVFQTLGGRSSLGLVKFKRISTIRAASCPTLARFTTGEAAVIDCESAAGRALVFASDLDNQWNDFPLHATFVPFMHEAMQYLSGGRRSSDYLVTQVPAGVPPVPGVAPFAAVQGAASRLVAVNVDPAESDPSRLTAGEFQTAVKRLQDGTEVEQRVDARQREESQHLWQYVLGLMMAMLIVESAVATRTA